MLKPMLASFTLSLALAGCGGPSAWESSFDSFSFTVSGGTLFSEPFKVTTKQLHFDTGELFGKDIILEGDVQYIGEASTHLLMSDPDGRMLVVTTGMAESYKQFDSEDIRHIKVLGTLERGKKGLPYLMAKAIRATPIDHRD